MKKTICTLILLLLSAGPSAAAINWVDAWAAVPDSSDDPMPAQTVRQTLRIGADGTAVRIRLSNLYGTAPLHVRSVCLALSAGESKIEPGTNHALTFRGKPELVLAKGGEAWSDPVAMPVAAFQALSISFYLPEPVSAPTVHGVALASAYAIPGRDLATAAQLDGAMRLESRVLLTDVQVAARTARPLLIALGDSVTDGVGSSTDRDHRWPDLLAQRLQLAAHEHAPVVLAAAISGNRILRPGSDPFVGPSALQRLDRDVLDRHGARWVVLLEGGNDIAASNMLKTPGQAANAQDIIEGMEKLIARAHARHVEVVGGTLIPQMGAKFPQFSEEGEAVRQSVNAWIRSSGRFDAVVDFDAILADPNRPGHLRPDFDSGDHAHPNDAGYQAMADVFDLQIFTRSKKM